MTSSMKLKLLFLISITFLIAIESSTLNKLKKDAQDVLQPGDTMQFSNTTISFAIPIGWTNEMINNNTQLTVTPPNLSSDEIVNVAVRDLAPEEKNMNITDLLLKQAKTLASMYPGDIILTPVLGPQEITLDKFKAGKYIAEANVFGSVYEGYIGAVKDEDKNKILFLNAAYDKKKSNSIRPGLDLILNNIKKKE